VKHMFHKRFFKISQVVTISIRSAIIKISRRAAS
jgi:hypothetical protein